MPPKILLLLFAIMPFACTGQNSVRTNEIFKTSKNKFGVKSKSGRVLIDTIYDGISNFYNLGRKTLPPNNKRYEAPVEFYLVRNGLGQSAVFDKDGMQVFHFTDCYRIEVDAHTKTVVKIVMLEDNRMLSYLYGFDGKLIFETSFENIGYINDSDLIALIVEDGQNDEFYLYNPFTRNKLGPFSHFNIYNQDSSPPFGMEKEDFTKYTTLNIIAVRQNFGSKYKWGFVDMKGKEMLPMNYKSFRVADQDFKKQFTDRASRPEGVEFLFYAYSIDDPGKMLLFDEKMEQYIYNYNSMTILKKK
jgi:hypothetical protein